MRLTVSLAATKFKSGSPCVATKISTPAMLILKRKQFQLHQDVSNLQYFRLYNSIILAPAAVNDLSMEWVRSGKYYQLEWSNPLKSHSKITGYHIIVEYPLPQSKSNVRNGQLPIRYLEKSSYVNRQVENRLKLEDVCSTHFDKVNVTIGAYSSDKIGTIIPGKPRD